MGRRLLSYILILVMVFGATVPVFAVTETQVSAFINPNGSSAVGAFTAITQIISGILNFKISFENWALLYGDGTAPTTALSFQDLMASLLHLQQWLVPSGSMSSNFMSLWDYVWYIAEEVSTLWGGWDSYFSNLTILPDLSGIASSISKWNLSTRQIAKVIYNNDGTVQVGGVDENNNPNYETGDFYRITQVGINAIEGILGRINNATLAHYNDTLTTWEHSTNTQTTFTPSSLANGLYRFLAYIQSDTSSYFYLVNDGWDTNYAGSISRYYNNTLLADANVLRSNFPLSIYYLIRTMNNSMNYGFYNTLYGYLNNQSYISPITLSSITFTPNSLISGIYTWLKWIQNPIARLSFVHANDDDIAAMRAAQNSGVDAMKTQLYDSANGGVTLSDMTDTFNTGKVAKQTFNSGVGFSTNGLFGFTDSGNWGFWSQNVMDDMDNVQMTRDVVYDMSAYNDHMRELEELYSSANNDSRNRDTGLHITRSLYEFPTEEIIDDSGDEER